MTWAPSGDSICYCSHDGTLNFCDLTGGEKGRIFKYTHDGLPFSKGRFIDENTFVAVGYDKAPFLFVKGNGGDWALSKVLDSGFDTFRDFVIKKGDKDFFKMKEVESDIKIPDAVK